MFAMLGDDYKPFSQRANRKGYNGNFNTLRSILGEDPLPEIPKRNASVTGEKFKKLVPPGAFEHDRAFKPGGVKPAKLETLQDFISKFPEWIGEKPTALTRKVEEDDDKKGWCVTYKERTRPTPSVALNYRNLKS